MTSTTRRWGHSDQKSAKKCNLGTYRILKNHQKWPKKNFNRSGPEGACKMKKINQNTSILVLFWGNRAAYVTTRTHIFFSFLEYCAGRTCRLTIMSILNWFFWTWYMATGVAWLHSATKKLVYSVITEFWVLFYCLIE